MAPQNQQQQATTAATIRLLDFYADSPACMVRLSRRYVCHCQNHPADHKIPLGLG
jgi:hypothetical protein